LRKNPIPLFFLFTLISISPMAIVRAESFVITLTASKQYYCLDETVYIYGNLTLDDVQINDTLVGLEVENPKNQSILVRTVATGDVSNKSWFIEVLNVIACDQYGNPKDSFTRGGLSYFKASVKNNDIENRPVEITINTYDSSNSPIGLSAFQSVIYANETTTIIISVAVPTTATLGMAKVYANVYSSRPKYGGKPFGPEKSNEFNITDSTGSLGEPAENVPPLNGNFNSSFHLPPTTNAGTFQIFASSMYDGWTAVNSTVFYVKVPGDVNGDFRVNLADLSLLGMAWWSTPSSPNWNPNCDFNQDNRVNLADLSVFGQYWGYTPSA